MFIAPEILMLDQNQKIDGKADIFSVGIILYVLCFLEYPYMSNNPLQVRNDIISGEINKRMNPFKKNPQYSDDLKFIYEKMVALDPKERYTSKQLLELPYFKNDSQLVSTVFEKDQEWIESAYQYILNRFYTISQLPLERIIQDIKMYLKILRRKKYFDTLVFFACHTILIDIYTNECLHLKVLKQFEDIEKEIPNAFLEVQLSINNYFTCIYFTRKIENSLKLEKNVDLKSPNFQKLLDENLKNEKISNPFSLMLIFEALAYSSYMKSDLENAFKYIQKSMKASFKINYNSFALDIAHLHNIAGIIYSKCGYEPLIEQYFLQSIIIRNDINLSKDKDPLYFGSCYFGSYLNLGNYYFKTEDFEKSRINFEKASKIYNNSPELKSLSKYNEKLEVNIAICHLYLHPRTLQDGNCFRTQQELEALSSYMNKLFNNDQFLCMEFLNALGIYYASFNSKTRALDCFKCALQITYEIKPNEIYSRIILNNIGVLYYIFGDNLLFPDYFNSAFQIFNINNYLIQKDERFFWIFINYLNYSMIQNTKNPLLQNGILMLEPFRQDFKAYYFNISRSIEYLSFIKNEFGFFNYEKYMHCFLTISNYIIFTQKSENYKKLKEDISDLALKLEDYRNIQKVSLINFLSKQLDYIKILINYQIIKNSPTSSDDYFDSFISEFLELLTILIRMNAKCENKIYFFVNIYKTIFFLSFKMYKKGNNKIYIALLIKLAEYNFILETSFIDVTSIKIISKIIHFYCFLFLTDNNINEVQKEELLEYISDEDKKYLNYIVSNKEFISDNKDTSKKEKIEINLLGEILLLCNLDKNKVSQIVEIYYPGVGKKL